MKPGQAVLFLVGLTFILAQLIDARGDKEEKQSTKSWSILTEFENVTWWPFFPIYKPVYDVAKWSYDWITSMFDEGPYDGDCGKQADRYQQDLYPNTRIIGSAFAKPNSWPWQVLLKDDYGGELPDLCGGSLIRVKPKDTKTDIIVTAAHCVTDNVNGRLVRKDRNRLTVIVGQHNRQSWFEYGRESVTVEKVIPSRYDLLTRGNDIALIKLTKPISFNSKIRPICLPEQGEPIPVDNKHCVATGWGVTMGRYEYHTLKKSNPKLDPNANKLKQIKMRLRTPSECRGDGGMSFLPVWAHFYIEDEMICAESPNGKLEENTCSGDSGGPLACLIDGKWTMYGISSFGETDCLGLKPDIFTRVSSYVDWILRKAANCTDVQ